MSLSQIVQQFRTQLITQESHADSAIRSAHSHMLSTIQPQLATLLKQYKVAKTGDESVPFHWLYTNNRLPSIKHTVTQQVGQFGSQAKAQVVQLQSKAVSLGTQSAHAQLATAAPAQEVKTPLASATSKLVGTTQQRKPLASIMDGFGVEASDKVGKTLITGVRIGQEPDTISKAIMAVLMISLYRALTADRTSAAEAYRASVLLTLQKMRTLSKEMALAGIGLKPMSFLQVDGRD